MNEFIRRWTVFGVKITFSWRSPRSLMGRFGGGWNWKIGVQAGGGTMLFSLLVAELVISWK